MARATLAGISSALSLAPLMTPRIAKADPLLACTVSALGVGSMINPPSCGKDADREKPAPRNASTIEQEAPRGSVQCQNGSADLLDIFKRRYSHGTLTTEEVSRFRHSAIARMGGGSDSHTANFRGPVTCDL